MLFTTFVYLLNPLKFNAGLALCTSILLSVVPSAKAPAGVSIGRRDM